MEMSPNGPNREGTTRQHEGRRFPFGYWNCGSWLQCLSICGFYRGPYIYMTTYSWFGELIVMCKTDSSKVTGRQCIGTLQNQSTSSRNLSGSITWPNYSQFVPQIWFQIKVLSKLKVKFNEENIISLIL